MNHFRHDVTILICHCLSIFVRYNNRFWRYNFRDWFTVFVRDNFSVIISDNPGDGSTVTVRHDISVIVRDNHDSCCGRFDHFSDDITVFVRDSVTILVRDNHRHSFGWGWSRGSAVHWGLAGDDWWKGWFATAECIPVS